MRALFHKRVCTDSCDDGRVRYYLLFYTVVDGFAEKRYAFRPAHLAYIEAAHASGTLLLAGAYGDPPSGAVLAFRTNRESDVEAFAKADPYVVNGLVPQWTAEPWNVVVGGL